MYVPPSCGPARGSETVRRCFHIGRQSVDDRHLGGQRHRTVVDGRSSTSSDAVLARAAGRHGQRRHRRRRRRRWRRRRRRRRRALVGGGAAGAHGDGAPAARRLVARDGRSAHARVDRGGQAARLLHRRGRALCLRPRQRSVIGRSHPPPPHARADPSLRSRAPPRTLTTARSRSCASAPALLLSRLRAVAQLRWEEGHASSPRRRHTTDDARGT